MGWRALRLALDRDTLMKAQARALLEAAAGRELNVMFPMVSEPWEFDAARKALVEEQRAWLADAQEAAARRRSATARCSKCRRSPRCSTCCCRRLDFLSIGTNDLTQFLFAADRSNPRLAERYDWLSPAILRFLRADRARGRQARGAARRLRRDGRAHARGDGADRHRHPPAVDHAGRGRPDQGDDPLARRAAPRSPRSTGCSTTPPRRHARARSPPGRRRTGVSIGLSGAAVAAPSGIG